MEQSFRAFFFRRRIIRGGQADGGYAVSGSRGTIKVTPAPGASIGGKNRITAQPRSIHHPESDGGIKNRLAGRREESDAPMTIPTPLFRGKAQ
jgi:hypothetical protein